MQKIIFAGTTEFGLPTLEKLKQQYELVLIITQPDRPAGRNKMLTPPPVKTWAQKNGIPVSQPEKITDIKSEILTLQPDLLLVVAYGQIIPKEILDISKFKSINIHGSILPKYRGASPIQATIINGDNAAGITLIQMDEQLDHGPIIAAREIPTTGQESFLQLYAKLAAASADLVAQTLPEWFAGTLQAREQNHAQASFTSILKREHGIINWSKPAREIYNQIRAYNPEPGTWTQLSGKTVKILEAEILPDHKIELPGKLYNANGELAVKTLDNGLLIKKIQPEGKNEMAGKDFLNGLKNLNDKIFI